MTELDPVRVVGAKRAFTTRRVPIEDMLSLLAGSSSPSSGDLVLARVEEIGKHKRLELTNGRRAHLFPGDEVIVCYGNRYAPDQYEAVVPVDLGGCDLVASGGVAARELSRHDRVTDPTRITPIGLIADARGTRLNLSNYAVPSEHAAAPITAVLVAGTSMNAGKTLAAASLVRGFRSQGHRVAAIKITGTGAGGDIWIMQDVGAELALDFTDAGFASTYKAPVDKIEKASFNLINHAANSGCTIAVIEIADGLMQDETAALLRSNRLRLYSSGVVFASYDSMGAKSGVDILKSLGHRVIAVCGRLTRSQLMIRETEHATGLPVFTPWELMKGAVARVVPVELEPHRMVGAIESVASRPTPSSPPRESGTASFGSARRVGLAAGSTPKEIARSEELVGQATGRETGVIGKTGGDNEIDDWMTVALSRKLLGFVANKIMEFEVDVLCGAARGRRRTEQRSRRNGYRNRRWKTDVGTVDIRVPRLRQGSYRPVFLNGRCAKKNALTMVLRGALAREVSTRSLRELVRAMGAAELSKTELSRLGVAIEDWVEGLDLGHARKVDPKVQSYFDRLSSGQYVYGFDDHEIDEDDEIERQDNVIGGYFGPGYAKPR